MRVTDASGASSVGSFAVTVANLPPQVTARGAASAFVGQAYTLALTYADPGADTVSTWFIDWGDGTTSAIPGSQTGATHVFAKPVDNGRISVRAQDDDGLWTATPLSPLPS